MSQASVLIDSGSPVALSTATVFPTLPGAVTGTGTAVAYQTTMSDLITFIGSNDGPFVYDSGTIVVSTPGLSITETWNAVGVTFKALVVSITDSASASGSLIAEYSVGGSAVFSITKAGAVTAATNLTLTNGLLTTTRSSSQLVARLQRDGSNRLDINVTTAGVVTWDAVGSAPSYAWDFNGVDIWRIDASGNLTGIAKPSAVGTTPGTTTTASAVTTGAGGNTTIATTGVGGAGGAWSLTTGAGGTAASAVTAATGGDGGAITMTTGAGTATAVVGAGTGTGGASGAFAIVTGVGGAASTSTGANQGGASGAFSITTGVGGAATNGSANTGGNSGAITLATGNGGAGTTAAGNSGSITFQTGTSGSTVGSIIFKPGTTTTFTVASTGNTIALASATAFQVGPNGATNPSFRVVTNTASAATGLNLTAAAAAGGFAVAVISSGNDENLTIDAKGTGTVTLNGTATGNIVLTRNAAFTNNLLVGGSVGATAAKTVALSNSATSPSTSVDLCHLYSLDISADHASLAIWSEEVVNAAAAVASTHRYPITINGTQYAILLTTVLA